MPLGEERRARRRERILQSTRDLLVRDGYDNITMDNIAEACGVTKPTLYNAFGSKDELLTAAVQDVYGRILARAAAPQGVRGLDHVIAILTVTAKVILRERERGEALIREVRTHADGPFGKAVHASVRDALDAAVDEMREDGELQPWIDTGLLTRRIAGIERNVNTEYGVGDLDGDQLVDMTVYAVCILLAGVTRDAAAERCRRIARERQAILTATPDAAGTAAAAGAG